MKELIALCV